MIDMKLEPDDADASTGETPYLRVMGALGAIIKKMGESALLLDIEGERRKAAVLEDIHRVDVNERFAVDRRRDVDDAIRHRAAIEAMYRDGFAAIAEAIRTAGKL